MIRAACSCAIALTTMLRASVADACPFCDSQIAEQVRAGIFNADFGYHLAVSLAPFPVFIGILLLIYHSPTSRSPRRFAQTRSESSKPSALS